MAEKIILEFHDKDWVISGGNESVSDTPNQISSNLPRDIEAQITSTLTLM
jgi:hypothetical protein